MSPSWRFHIWTHCHWGIFSCRCGRYSMILKEINSLFISCSYMSAMFFWLSCPEWSMSLMFHYFSIEISWYSKDNRPHTQKKQFWHIHKPCLITSNCKCTSVCIVAVFLTLQIPLTLLQKSDPSLGHLHHTNCLWKREPHTTSPAISLSAPGRRVKGAGFEYCLLWLAIISWKIVE